MTAAFLVLLGSLLGTLGGVYICAACIDLIVRMVRQ